MASAMRIVWRWRESSAVGCMESERRALLAIKSDMYDPDEWLVLFLDKQKLLRVERCGVACKNITGHVTMLDLRYPYTYHQDLETVGGSKVNPSLQELNNFSGAPLPRMIASLVHL
ncbi:hypothetical protein BHM03_00046758, partial [Ensete ventricosum]